jgi:hypothetical protein
MNLPQIKQQRSHRVNAIAEIDRAGSSGSRFRRPTIQRLKVTSRFNSYPHDNAQNQAQGGLFHR